MKISTLLEHIKIKESYGDMNVVVDSLSQDTREDFSQNTLYFALAGTQVDGHVFIETAIEKGAKVILCEKMPEEKKENILYLAIENLRESLGSIVSRFFGDPSADLELIAVTGTNGKTTVATLLYQSFISLGQKAALFSTAGDFMNGELLETKKKAASSMETIEFQKNLKKAKDAGCRYVCIEATSHALDQYRLSGTKIARAIFMNLTQDHLDYHPNMDHYARSKKRLFDILGEDAIAFSNVDDPYGVFMVSESRAKIITYGDIDYNNALVRDLNFKILGFGLNGTRVEIDGLEIDVPLVGRFNMYNLISVYGVLKSYEIGALDIKKAFSEIAGPRGRMEIISASQKKCIGIVDYAHTPDALENVLSTLSDLPHNNIITVVGAGGDRDTSKRPQMAAIAEKYSQYLILTSDNPRTENPEDILRDMIAGCDLDSGSLIEKIIDRELAIKKATEIAEEGDIILVAGKGHEDYQIIGDKTYYFSDVEVLEKYL